MRGSLADLTSGEAGRLSEAGEIQQWTCDYRILTRDGKTRRVSDSAVQIRDGNNRRIGVIGILQDITERKFPEERIEQSEARYRLIAENVRDVIWVMDVETQRFTYVSPSSLKLRGYTPEEIVTQSLSLMEELSGKVKTPGTAHLQPSASLQAGTARDSNEPFNPQKTGKIL